jgi:hypothetical protein
MASPFPWFERFTDKVCPSQNVAALSVQLIGLHIRYGHAGWR